MGDTAQLLVTSVAIMTSRQRVTGTTYITVTDHAVCKLSYRGTATVVVVQNQRSPLFAGIAVAAWDSPTGLVVARGSISESQAAVAVCRGGARLTLSGVTMWENAQGPHGDGVVVKDV